MDTRAAYMEKGGENCLMLLWNLMPLQKLIQVPSHYRHTGATPDDTVMHVKDYTCFSFIGLSFTLNEMATNLNHSVIKILKNKKYRKKKKRETHFHAHPDH